MSARPLRTRCTELASQANRHAQKLGAVGRIGTQDVWDLFQRQPECVRCGSGRGIDHIIALRLGGANDPSNIQTMCLRCNGIKHWEDMRAAGWADVKGTIPNDPVARREKARLRLRAADRRYRERRRQARVA